MTEQKNIAVEQAIAIFETQKALADAVGVTQGMVSFWLLGKTEVTWDKAIKIEQVTRGQVTRHDLRPDIFGQSLPAA